MFRQAIRINTKQYRTRILLIILAGILLNALCFNISIQNKTNQIRNIVTAERENPSGLNPNSYHTIHDGSYTGNPVPLNGTTIKEYKALYAADFSKVHDRISLGRLFYGTSVTSFTGTTSDKLNFYQTAGLLQGVPIFIIGILSIILAMLLTSAEKMSRFAVFLSTIPISRSRLYTAKGLVGLVAVGIVNLIAWGIGLLMLYTSELGPYINYGTHHSYHLIVWIQSMTIFLIAMFVGSLCGNIISHALTMIPVLMGVLFFYLYCIMMPLLIMGNVRGFFLEEPKFIYSPSLTPGSLMIRLVDNGPLVFLIVFAVLLFGAGIWITKKERSWRFGYFFTNPVADRIIFYLAVYSFSLIPILIFGMVPEKLIVLGIFVVSLFINYFLFRFLFRLRFAA